MYLLLLISTLSRATVNSKRSRCGEVLPFLDGVTSSPSLFKQYDVFLRRGELGSWSKGRLSPRTGEEGIPWERLLLRGGERKAASV